MIGLHKPGCIFDLPAKQDEIERLQAESGTPDFWNDPATAQKTLRRLTEIQSSVSVWGNFDVQLSDMAELLDIAELDDPDMSGADTLRVLAGVETDLAALTKELETHELALLFTGTYDDHPALLAISQGLGGSDAADFVQMLQRMYLRWADIRKFAVTILDISPSEEVGLKSTTLEISGTNVYGMLKGEIGVHRLIRLSPFNANHTRQTSFAKVEVLPEVDEVADIVVRDEDIKMDVYRSTGAGGQNVNKTSTAVRLTHIPSGIVVAVQNERSQVQNRDTALKILKARLLEREMVRQAEERARLKGENVSAAFGNQIRTYTLQPYTLVKDHRTGAEVGNVAGVLDGEIDPFVESYLRWQIDNAPAVDTETND